MGMTSKMALCIIQSLVFLSIGFVAAFGQNELKGHAAMIKGVEILVVIDNNAYKPGIETHWGFSCLVRGMDKTILFDTGPSGSGLLHNMTRMGIKPQDVDVVVLSHIHGDHTGGLDGFLKENGDVTIYLPRSFPQPFKKKAEAYGAEVIEVGGPLEICHRVYSTGELGEYIKEQALVIHTDIGGIVITGCAHPDIVKILRKAKGLVKHGLLLAMGGFHLGGATPSELERITASFKDLRVRYIGPCHCSGDGARNIFKKTYQTHFLNVGVGIVIRVSDLK